MKHALSTAADHLITLIHLVVGAVVVVAMAPLILPGRQGGPVVGSIAVALAAVAVGALLTWPLRRLSNR
jgi:hypothetical protein